MRVVTLAATITRRAALAAIVALASAAAGGRRTSVSGANLHAATEVSEGLGVYSGDLWVFGAEVDVVVNLCPDVVGDVAGSFWAGGDLKALFVTRRRGASTGGNLRSIGECFDDVVRLLGIC